MKDVFEFNHIDIGEPTVPPMTPSLGYANHHITFIYFK